MGVTGALLLAACGGGGDDGSDDNAGQGGNGGESSGEVVTIPVAHVQPTEGVEHVVLEDLVQEIEEESDGTLKLEIYPNGQLGTTQDVIEQAASGEDIIGYTDASALAQMGASDLAILGGPFLFETQDEALAFARSDMFQQMADDAAESTGVRILALNWFDGPRHMFGHEAYPEPSDLEGVKVRTPPVDTWTDTFSLLGAVPTSVDNTETYSALDQGVVDAAEGPINGTAVQGWQEVAQEVTLTSHFQLFLGFGISDQTFQSLTPEQQDLLTEKFIEGGERATEQHNATTQENMDAFEEQGVTFHEADIPAYQEATAPFYDSFDDLVDQVREAAQS